MTLFVLYFNMEIYISIDGVIRNTIQKFDYHYNDAFLADDIQFEEGNSFEYVITEPIQNNNLLDSYNFQSKEEFENFLFIEYPIVLRLRYSLPSNTVETMHLKNPGVVSVYDSVVYESVSITSEST